MILRDVTITEHICERYIERFNPNLAAITTIKERLNAARKAINAILDDAVYLSDDPRGILLKSDTYKCKLVVKDRTLITILPLSSTKKKSQD